MTKVFLATPAERFILSSLMDFSGAGLLKEFAWAEFKSEGIPESFLNVSQGKIVSERAVKVVNQATLGTRLDIIEIRRVQDDTPAITLDQENRFLDTYRVPQGVSKTLTRFVIPWEPQAVIPDFTNQVGWVNYVFSPEISANSAYTPDPWWGQPAKREATAVANIVTLANLWSGQPDDAPANPAGTETRVVKTFVCGVNRAKLREEILDEALQYSTDYRPLLDQDSRSEMPLYTNSAEAATYMGNQWWSSVQNTIGLDLAYPQYQQDERLTMTAGEAIKQFFRFIWYTIKGLPSAFITGAVRSLSSRVAGFVERMAFGSDSVVRVVFGGYDANGLPADMSEVTKSGTLLLERTNPEELRNQETVAGFATFLRNFFTAGLTLADGGSSAGAGMNPVMVGNRPATVKEAKAVAIDPKDWKRTPDRTTLKASQVSLIELELARLDSNPVNEAVALKRDEARSWLKEIKSSFVGQAATQLSNLMAHTRSIANNAYQCMERYRQRLEELNSYSNKLKKPLWIARLISLLMILLIVLAVVVNMKFKDDWGLPDWFLWVVIPVIIVIWIIALLLASRSFTEAVRIEREIEFIEKQFPLLKKTINMAAKNMVRISQAQMTLDAWAPLLAEYIHRPLGHLDEEKTHYSQFMNLADCVQIAYSEVDQDSFERRVIELRHSWQHRGWANQFWDLMIPHIVNLLPLEERIRFGQNPSTLFQLPYTDPVIETLINTVTERGIGDVVRQAAREAWNQESLPETVQVGKKSLTLEQFQNQVKQSEESMTLDEIFTADSVTRRRNMARLWDKDDFAGGGFQMSAATYGTENLNANELSILAASDIGSFSMEQSGSFAPGSGAL